MKRTRPYVRSLLRVSVLFALAGLLVGCGDHIQLPSVERLAEFERAGPSGPAVDMDRLVRARIFPGPYRVNCGDVLQLALPAVLYPDVPATEVGTGRELTHTCRVSDAGSITVPDGRQIPAVGNTLAEIEADVVEAYYPNLVKTRPSVYARVLEYRTYRVQITGAVTIPGVYNLRRDQLSLVSLLMEAGGIVEGGAAAIRIVPPERESGDAAKVLPMGLLRTIQEWDVRQASSPMQTNPRYSSAGICLRFRPEGALRTTGTLVIEQEGDVRVERWLDLGSNAQRQSVLREVADGSRHSVNARLAELATFLDSRSSRSDVYPAAYGPGLDWTFENGTHSVTLPGDGPGAPSRAKTVAAAYETPASADNAETDSKPAGLILPVRGLNIPFADVPLQEGTSVIVERLQPRYVSVLGLVRAPGNFDYPSDAEYNLAQVVGFAGGLDLIADPRYVSVYRPKSDGTVASATFQLVNPRNQEALTARLAMVVRPGDVVSVEHTLRTRANVLFDRVIRISLGFYLNPQDLWE